MKNICIKKKGNILIASFVRECSTHYMRALKKSKQFICHIYQTQESISEKKQLSIYLVEISIYDIIAFLHRKRKKLPNKILKEFLNDFM